MYWEDTDMDQVRALENFKREVTTLRALGHPNIVRYIGMCVEADVLAVVTEYLVGGSLWGLLHPKRNQNFKLKLGQAVRIAYDIAMGMSYLHGQEPQILHRDLSTQNILLDQFYNAKIGDFGLARLRESTTEKPLTRISHLDQQAAIYCA